MVMKLPPVILSGAVTITGAATESSTLAVAGASTLTGAVSAGATLAVTGATTLSGATTQTGALTASSTGNFTGAVTVGGALVGSSTASITGASTLNGAITANSTASIGGAATITGALSSTTQNNTGAATVGGAATITGAITASSTLNLTGASTLGGAATFSSTADHTAGLVKFMSGQTTALGTNLGTAATITGNYAQVTSAAASTGVALPALAVGQHVYVQNDGANAIKVYAQGSDSIDGTAGSTGVTLTNAKRAMFYAFSANNYRSAQLSTPSA